MCIMLCSLGLSAQQFHTPHTQYLYNPYIFNPARAGFGDGYPQIFMNYRRQWVEMSDSPVTKIITADGRLGSKRKREAGEHPLDDVGVGGIFYQDNTFLIKRTGGVFSYAYHFLPPPNTTDKEKYDARYHQFSMGVSTGFLRQNIDWKRVNAQDLDDNLLFTDEVSQTVFDLNFGMAYQYHTRKKRNKEKKGKRSFETLNLDLSIIQAPATRIRYFQDTGDEFVENEDIKLYKLEPHFIGGINLDFHVPPNRTPSGRFSNFYMKPGMLFRAAPGKPIQFDFSLLTRFELQDKVRVVFGGGMKTSPENPIVGVFSTVGLHLSGSTGIYYNFESLHPQALGISHEVMVGYTFGRKLKKRVDQIETITMRNDSNVVANNKKIIENDYDIRPDIETDFINEYSRIRSGRIEKIERELVEVHPPLDFTDNNAKTIDPNIKSKLEAAERIYIVAHHYKELDPDKTKTDMKTYAESVKNTLVNKLDANPYKIHVVVISEPDIELKNHISILGRYPKE